MKLRSPQSQRGMTMLMVMLLMTAMLMGALSFARVTEVGTLVSNNVANKDASFHAAEVGRATAVAALQALANKDANSGGWYWARRQTTDAVTGLPTTVNFANTPTVPGNVARFTVTYAVERMCEAVGVIDDSSRLCLSLVKPDDEEGGDPPDMAFDEKDYMKLGARQYRITVRVTDARGMQTFTQSLVTAN